MNLSEIIFRLRQRLALLEVAFLDSNKLLERVKLQLELNPQVNPADLAYRVISEQLYLACLSQDYLVQESGYGWLGGHLYRYILPKLHSQKELAQDITNEALATICNKLETCRSPYHFLTWCRQVAVHLVLQHCRKEKSLKKSGFVEVSLEELQTSGDNIGRADLENDGSEGLFLTEFTQKLDFSSEVFEAEGKQADFNIDPQKVVVNKEQLDLIIQKVMATKPTKRAKSYQQIFFGTYFQGLTDQELAQKLGLSLAEIHKRRFQLLTILRSDRDFLEKLR